MRFIRFAPLIEVNGFICTVSCLHEYNANSYTVVTSITLLGVGKIREEYSPSRLSPNYNERAYMHTVVSKLW